MKEWGVTLIFIGLGSFVLPMIGLQFRLLNLFGGSPAAGMFVAAVGGVLLAIGLIKERSVSVAVGKPQTDPKERQASPQPSVSEPQNQPTTTGLRCSACGTANAQGDQFCGSCGATLVVVAPPSAQTCAQCGTPVSPSEGFCGECGAPVSGARIDRKPIAQIEHATVTVTPTPTKTRKHGGWLKATATVSVLLLGGVGVGDYFWGNGFRSLLIRQAGEAARALDLWHLFTPPNPSDVPALSQQKTETSAPNVSVPTSGSTKREAQNAPAKTPIAATKPLVNSPVQAQQSQSEQARIQPETETARPKTEEERVPRRQPIRMGVSTQSEVEQVFGQPVSQLNDAEFEYKPPPGAAKLYVQYRSRSGVVERIVWNLPEPRSRAAMVQSLKLPEQSLGTRLTPVDHLSEYFGAPSFLVLRYSSKEISGSVISLIYYSADAFQRVAPVAQASRQSLPAVSTPQNSPLAAGNAAQPLSQTCVNPNGSVNCSFAGKIGPFFGTDNVSACKAACDANPYCVAWSVGNAPASLRASPFMCTTLVAVTGIGAQEGTISGWKESLANSSSRAPPPTSQLPAQ
jgi:uncharacterized OB-fold protein